MKSGEFFFFLSLCIRMMLFWFMFFCKNLCLFGFWDCEVGHCFLGKSKRICREFSALEIICEFLVC